MPPLSWGKVALWVVWDFRPPASHRSEPPNLILCRGTGSILRPRGQLPEKGTFTMTKITIITKKASLNFPILLFRLLLEGGGGS